VKIASALVRFPARYALRPTDRRAGERRHGRRMVLDVPVRPPCVSWVKYTPEGMAPTGSATFLAPAVRTRDIPQMRRPDGVRKLAVYSPAEPSESRRVVPLAQNSREQAH